jgi:hypothetical protein
MKRTLTPEQVKKLFAWCEKYEVYDYDLQLEIVDHLASAIEHQWKENPELSFGWALKNIRDKFGWRDFRKLERKMQRQLKHKFRRILFNYFTQYLKLPKITITFCLAIIFFILLQLLENNSILIILYCIPISVASVYSSFVLFPKKIEINLKKEKSFMILEYLHETNKNVSTLALLPLYGLFFFNLESIRYSNLVWQEIFIALIMAFASILLWGYFFYLPEKIRNYFIKNYPEYAQ